MGYYFIISHIRKYYKILFCVIRCYKITLNNIFKHFFVRKEHHNLRMYPYYYYYIMLYYIILYYIILSDLAISIGVKFFTLAMHLSSKLNISFFSNIYSNIQKSKNIYNIFNRE